jgi:hypothetical protein
MKKVMIVIVTASAALLMSGAAMAQSLMTAEIPFEFQFAGEKLPAGQYHVDTSNAARTGAVLIRHDETHKTAVSLGIHGGRDAVTENRPHLVFRCAGSGCVLHQVWTPLSEYIYSVPKAEKGQYSASIPMSAARGE